MEHKYIKYKSKYLELKNNNIIQTGGNKQMIIHEKKIKVVEYDKKLCVLNNIDSDKLSEYS